MVAQIRVYGFGEEIWFNVYINDIVSIIIILRSVTAHIIKQGIRYQPKIDVISSIILLKCIERCEGRYNRESIADIDPRSTYNNTSEMTYELDIERIKISYTFNKTIVNDSEEINSKRIKELIKKNG